MIPKLYVDYTFFFFFFLFYSSIEQFLFVCFFFCSDMNYMSMYGSFLCS